MPIDAENVPGLGGGSSLVARNLFSPSFGNSPTFNTIDKPALSTYDYYHNGPFLGRPFDLNAMGSWGAARIAAKGYRYLWIIAPNHETTYAIGALDAINVFAAYSNDPAIMPDPATMVPIINGLGTKQTGTAATFTATVASDGVTMNVTAITPGTTNTSIICLGYNVVGLPQPAYIAAMGTDVTGGGLGGTGNYLLSANQGGSVGSRSLTCTLGGSQLFDGHFFPWFVYNSDEPSAPGFLYIQTFVGSNGINTNAWNTGLFTTNDLDTWTFQGVSMTNSTGAGGGFVSQMQVYRRGTGDWIAYGSQDSFLPGRSYWTSTDGRRFTAGSNITTTIGKSSYQMGWSDKFTISSQDYLIANEDARGSFWQVGTTYAAGDRVFVETYTGGPAYPTNFGTGPFDQHYYEFQTYISQVNSNTGNNPATDNGTHWLPATDGGMFLSQVAIDSDGNMLSSPAPTRLSAMYQGTFPGPTYISTVNGYLEDGILYAFVDHGFAAGLNPSTLALPYNQGGGLAQEYWDIYPIIVDATAAASAAPCGVRASCAGGNVLLRWYDVIPQHTYRIKRGTSPSTITTHLADVTSVSNYLDTTATPGSVYYYSVTTLNSGTEEGSRAVSVYVGIYDRFTNQHITRALAAGADATTIDERRIAKLVRLLKLNGLLQNTFVATFAWTGVIQNATTHVVSRAFDLGTTLLPRMGDFTPWDTGAAASTTTYSATAVNSASPGFVQPNITSFGMYGNYGKGQGSQGRSTPFRLGGPDGTEGQLTCIAAYQKNGSGQFTALSMGEFLSGITLQETSGAPGGASFSFDDFISDPTTPTATATLSGSGVHVIAGVYNGSNVTCWGDGTAGTPVSTSGNFAIAGLLAAGAGGATDLCYFLGTGSTSLKLNVAADTTVGGTYVWENTEAKGTVQALLVFNTALTAEQMQEVTQFLKDDATAITDVSLDSTYSAHGDGILSAATYSITNGSTSLTTTSSMGWTGADVGKLIGFKTSLNPFASNPAFGSTIASVVSTSHVTLADAYTGSTLSNFAGSIEWGTDDRSALAAFNSAQAGSSNIVRLTLTTNKRYTIGPKLQSGQPSINPTFGIKNLIVQSSGGLYDATPAVISDVLGTASGANLGGCGQGQMQDSTHSAFVNTVAAGATTTTLITSSDSSRFSAPSKVLITGYETQDDNQTPTNPYFYEYPRLESIAGSSTITFTFQSPLKNGYKSTWPNWGTHGGAPTGPACVYALESGWDCDHEYISLGMEEFGLVNSIGRKITYTNGHATGFGIYPSRIEQWATNGVNQNVTAGPTWGAIGNEIDKIVGWIGTYGGQNKFWNVQSSSPYYNEAECWLVTTSFAGSPQNMKMYGCVVEDSGAGLGPHSYGAAQSFYAEACQFAGFGIGGQVESDVQGAGAYQFLGNGIIKRAKSAGTSQPPVWCVPIPGGGPCFFGTGGGYVNEFPFNVLDVTEDGTSIFISTTLGGLPTIPQFSGSYSIRAHPSPNFTLVDCQGCSDAGDMTGNPTASVYMRSYTGSTLSNWATQQPFSASAWGRLVSLTVDVIKPYTGTLSTLTMNIGDQFGAPIVNPNGTSGNYSGTIDVKTAGARVITPTTVINNKTNDTITPAPGLLWWANENSPYLNASISGESSAVWPIVQVTLQLDQLAIQQAITAGTFIMPLRLRWHA